MSVHVVGSRRAVEHFRLDFVELSKLLSPGPGQSGYQGHQGHHDRLHLWAEFFMISPTLKKLRT